MGLVSESNVGSALGCEFMSKGDMVQEHWHRITLTFGTAQMIYPKRLA